MLMSDLALSMKKLSDATSSKLGQDYFNALVTFLGVELSVDFVFIGELTDNNTTIRSKAVFAHGQLAPPLSYLLKDTPCEQVVGKSTCVYSKEVQQSFPSDILLQEMGVESYVGAPLFSLEGKPIGVIAALHREQLPRADYIQTCFDLVVGRVAAEYERLCIIEDLILKDKKLTDLIACTSDLVWETNENLEYTSTSSTPDGVLGYDTQEMLGKTPFDFMPKGELERIRPLCMSLLHQQKAFANLEIITVNKNGAMVHMETSGVPFYDSEGCFIGYRGIDTNITDRKTKEAELKLAATVLETATEAVMVTNSLNEIIKVNDAFTAITGYSKNEVLNQNPSILQSGRHDKFFYTEMLSHLTKHGKWEGEIWNRRKSGEIYPQWLTITTMLDNQEVVTGYAALFSDISKRKEYEERIEYQANYDSLTGVANRHLFEDRFSRAIGHGSRSNSSVALLFIDLDNFKTVNDRFNHSYGDRVLQEAANRISGNTRKSDTVSRLGGDEFTVILTDLNQQHHAENAITAILDSLSEPFFIEGHEIFLSASIGVTVYPRDGANIEQLLRNADSAMYKAKDSGRNTFHYYSKDLHIEAEKRYSLISALRKAMNKNEFTLNYQPIVEASSKRVVGCEALIRWESAELGSISPVEFIPLAEDVGLISTIGEWVLNEACRQLSSIVDICSQDFFLAINFSSIQFQKDSVPSLVKKALKRFGLASYRIHIEVTESLMLDEDSAIRRQLEELRHYGVDISIDDFGTGYSSLSYLQKYPITTLKIDRAFVQDISSNSQNHSLVKAIIAMSKSLGLRIIAEGIEEEDQAAILLDEGCEFFQGYLYSKPLPFDKLKSFIRNKH